MFVTELLCETRFINLVKMSFKDPLVKIQTFVNYLDFAFVLCSWLHHTTVSGIRFELLGYALWEEEEEEDEEEEEEEEEWQPLLNVSELLVHNEPGESVEEGRDGGREEEEEEEDEEEEEVLR